MVARHEGRVVFVPDVIPGERVLAEVTDDSKSSFWRAEAVKILEPSVHRREHIWHEASISRSVGERAGGAEFGHIDLAFQRELKSRVLQDALARFAKIDQQVDVQGLPGDSGIHWRTRVKLHVDAKGRIGPYAARTHEVVPVTSLPLATVGIAELIDFDRKYAGRSISLVDPSFGEPFIVSDPLMGISELVDGMRFHLAASSFWQVHREAASAISQATIAMVDRQFFDPMAHNLDLYGGAGLLAASVLSKIDSNARIESVEYDRVSSGFATRNLERFHRASAIRDDVEHYLQGLSLSGKDLAGATVVLDPPRKGAGESVMRLLADLNPAQIIYVACDPIALARDLGLINQAGFALKELVALDLFPNTHHFEVIARLEPQR